MRDWADFSLEASGNEETTVVFFGSLCVSTLGDLDRRLAGVSSIKAVDIARIGEIDTSGAWVIWSFATEHGAEILGASEKSQRLIDGISSAGLSGDIGPNRAPLFQRVFGSVGTAMLNGAAGIVRVVEFMGALLVSVKDIVRHPSRWRGKAVVQQMEAMGVSSLGIIGLMSFLVGIVIAQQGAVQLRQFGAEFYTINLTGRLSLRELGILMTAIMVAGRSGSAFAAQLGVMRLTEEVDAMRTIGVSPMESLIVPRVLAAMIMMPLLGFYASVCSILGGAVISAFSLGIPLVTFLSRIQEVVPLHDLWICLVKAPFFGFIIAVAGCYHGMQVKGSAEQVGSRTTQAVVTGIFAVIVLDAFFAIFFSEVGWG